ncbi:MAG: flavodoxin family protein [Lentisphaerae bacterium]|jgi:multimeric flavodoxin WrbA|nr:flavodoxin family protein [Lentisphaerota bacterium]MBT4820613.1 flavodoxin family protein [Lentisphaerota bacterium]MBT5612069.1 flavodoxin family protein [Lentisphaerota bacterium]MBT7061888.1 flavodoxin family protein [Lentisphaerota bacterium]MBT7846249.1 flavodoxin family protein [Lentisphaerota bacterium]
MKKVLIVYHSQEKGNTHRMAELVAQGCREAEGIAVQMINVNERRVDMDTAEQADAYALGSPDYFSYVAGNLKQFFDDILLANWGGRATTGKPYVGFLTHGGGGTAIGSLDRLAKATKLVPAAPNAICQGAPEAAQDVENSIALGRQLAEHLTKGG